MNWESSITTQRFESQPFWRRFLSTPSLRMPLVALLVDLNKWRVKGEGWIQGAGIIQDEGWIQGEGIIQGAGIIQGEGWIQGEGIIQG